MATRKWYLWIPLILLLLLGYGFILAGYFFMQVHLIYKPEQALKSPEYYGLSDFTTVKIDTADNLQLIAWYHPAQKNNPTILFFHGNSGHIGERANLVLPYVHKGFGVFLFEYRGYGNNPGEPAEGDNINDAQTALTYLRQHTTTPHCIILYGQSLGSGVAVALAAKDKVSAVILQAPFTNLDAVAKKHYPFLPVELLLKEHYDSLSRIAQIHAPLLIVHGNVDTTIPMEEGQTLYQQALPPKEFVIAQGKDHNNIDSTWIADTTVAFLQREKVCVRN